MRRGSPQRRSNGSVLLVGATFPSGATTAAQVIVWADGSGAGLRSQAGLLEVAPAGSTLLDRVSAVPSVLRGGREAYDADGTSIMRLPLTEGSGTAATTGNPGDATIRLFDRSGKLLDQAPLTGPVGG